MCETPGQSSESYSWVSSWFSGSKVVDEDSNNSCSLDCPQAVPTNRCSDNVVLAVQNCAYAPEEDMCAVRPLCFEESTTDCTAAVNKPNAVTPKASKRQFNYAAAPASNKSCRNVPTAQQQEPCYDPSATPVPAGPCFVGPPPDAYGCLPPHLPVEDPNCAPVVTSSDFVHSFMWKAAECEKCANNNSSRDKRSRCNNDCREDEEDPQCQCCDEFDPCACDHALEALDLAELNGTIPECDCQANGCLDLLAANADILCQFHKDVNDIRDKLHEQAQCMQQEALEKALERYQQSLKDAEESLKDCHNQNLSRIQEDRQNLGQSLAPKIDNLKQCIHGLQCQLQKCQCEKQKLQNTLGRMVNALQNTLNSPDDCIPSAMACAAKKEDTASKCGGDRGSDRFGEGRLSRGGIPTRSSCTGLNSNVKPSGPSVVIKKAEDGAAPSPAWSLRRKLSIVNCSYVRESVTRLISPLKPSHQIYKDLSKNPFSQDKPATISDFNDEYHFGLSTSDH